ncbi:MAG: hypothetical protein EP329_06955, partial [Deltaproteobacteria bacterium]
PDAVARCEATLGAAPSRAALLEVCAAALPAPRCADALTTGAPREALEVCGADLCPTLAVPRPLACGLDAASLTDDGVHDVFVELVAHTLTPAVGEVRARAVARGFGDGAFAPPEREEPVAARVNGVPIPVAELEAELRRASFMASEGATAPSEVLARLVDRELLRQLGEREGITLSDAEIEAEYDAFVAVAPPGFLSWITAAGRGTTDIRAMVVEKLAVEKLLEARGALAVSKEAQRGYYDTHPERFEEAEKRRVWEIFVAAPRGTPREARLAAFERVVAAHEALIGGEPFDSVARRLSDGRRNEEGGDLGVVAVDVFPPEVGAAVLALADGELSRPLLSDLGFHLVRVGERRPARRIPFTEAQPWIAEYLRARTFRSERERLVAELREHARIEIP